MKRHHEDEWSNYIDGGLPAERVARLDSHLSECERCRRTVEELRLIRQWARTFQAAPAPVELWEPIEARLEARSEDGFAEWPRPAQEVPSEPSGHRWQVPLRLVAALVLAAVLGVVSWRSQERSIEDSRPRPASVPGARQVEVTDDGTVAEIRRLEALLAREREALDPRTLEVIEESLSRIDEALKRAEEALAREPGNDLYVTLRDKSLGLKRRTLANVVERGPRSAGSGRGGQT